MQREPTHQQRVQPRESAVSGERAVADEQAHTQGSSTEKQHASECALTRTTQRGSQQREDQRIHDQMTRREVRQMPRPQAPHFASSQRMAVQHTPRMKGRMNSRQHSETDQPSERQQFVIDQLNPMPPVNH